MDRHERGRLSEGLARDLLVEHGLEPVDANWRCRLGELDLIMREPLDGTIVFVEVRYRTRASLGGPLESVDRAKRSRLRRAALAWLQRHGDLDAPARIDVVAIGPPPERAVSACPGSGTGAAAGDEGSSPDPGAGLRPERIVVRRGGCVVEWIVSAVEDTD